MDNMFLSKYILPILKDDPRDAVVASHKLMLRAGLIRQVGSGLYSWLPFGFRVMQKIEDIIRQEMSRAGAIEVSLPCMQPLDLWKKSGRHGAEGDMSAEMLIIKDRAGNDLTFAPSAEEVVVDLLMKSVQSYKDLPKNVYQITTKFRDEIRPRFGVMRAREFSMKDGYSFDIDEVSAGKSYESMFIAYLRIYARLGLNVIPVKADTGSIGGDLSHEFHVPAKSGESIIFYDPAIVEYLGSEELDVQVVQSFYAASEEKHSPENAPVQFSSSKGIEVGHIFYLGDKYSKSLEMKVQDADGLLVHPQMGCYGIGVSRLVAAIIEAHHDEKGIIWPASIAPFDVMVLNLRPGDTSCDFACADMYEFCRNNGKDVLLDDTSVGIREKFVRSELIGIPIVIAIGPKGIALGRAELRLRRDGSVNEMDISSIKENLLEI